MSFTLHTYMPNYRAWKALVAAAYNEVKIDVPELVMGKDNKTPEFLAKNPMGKVPVLDTPHGSVFESNAIARYVARLRQDTDLLGKGFSEQGQVDQWIDFCAYELEPTRAIWLYPIFGFMEFDAESYKTAVADVTKVMTVLDKHLLTRTFMVGNKITLADIVLACTLVDLYRLVFEPSFRAKFVNVQRWFETIINQPNFAKVVGKFEFAAQETKAKTDGKKKEEAKPKKEEAKPKKEEAPKPKKEEKAPEQGDEEDEEPKSKKAPNPLDLLPPTNMKLDNTKKLFFEKRPNFDAFFAEFWNFFDANGYCFYNADYQYDAENKVFFMTCNLVGGFLQRLEEAAKYTFGVVTVTGADEDTAPFAVSGNFMFRGSEVPKEVQECPDSEYYTWTKLDTSNPEVRKMIEERWYGAAVKGQKVLERRYFK